MSELIENVSSNFIWINGEFVKSADANIHVLTHSLHYSGSVYEGERAYKGKVFKLHEHTERLLKSAECFGMYVDYSVEEIKAITYDLLARNGLDYAYVRPLIWRGAESMKIYTPDLSTNFMIAAIKSKNDFKTNVKLNVGKWRKANPNALPPQAKSAAHYGMSIATLVNSQKEGYDDSLMLDYEGFIAECTVSNIFFGKGKNIITPIPDRFLNGITRQSVIEMAKNLGFQVLEERIALPQLTDYDFCFITGTAKEIVGVGKIDADTISYKFPDSDKTTEFLQAEFAKMVGK